MVNCKYQDLFFIIILIPFSLLINLNDGYEFFLLGFILFLNLYSLVSEKSSLIEKYLFLCLSVFIMLLCGSYFNENLDILIGPDEYRFYQEYIVYSYDRVKYLNDAISHVAENNFFHSSSYPVFGFFINPVVDFFRFGDISPKYIIPVNFFLLFLIFLLLKRIIPISKDNNTYLLFVLLSPAVVYHSLVYAKDILSLFLIFLACLAGMKKKIVLFAILIVIASLLRPYSIAIVFVYLAFFFLPVRYIFLSSFFCLLIAFIFTGVSGIFNAFITVPYLIISPNPTNIFDGRSDYLPLYFESIVFSVVYVVSILTCIYKKKIDLLIIFHLCLVVYSVVMVLVGYSGSVAYGNSYGFGDMGGNLVRKKIPMIPLILLFFYCSLTSKYKDLVWFRYYFTLNFRF